METYERRLGVWVPKLVLASDVIIVGLFITEAVLKMASRSTPLHYFRDLANTFDFVVAWRILLPAFLFIIGIEKDEICFA